jgi:hypothetical protein
MIPLSDDVQALLYCETDLNGPTALYKHSLRETDASAPVFPQPYVTIIWGMSMGKALNRHHTPQVAKV